MLMLFLLSRSKSTDERMEWCAKTAAGSLNSNRKSCRWCQCVMSAHTNKCRTATNENVEYRERPKYTIFREGKLLRCRRG